MSAVPLLLICLVMLANTSLSSASCTYNITLETGSTHSASTSVGVMVKLHEDTLSTPWILLHNKSGTRFQRNSKFKVSFDAVCMTKPCVTLRMMTSGDAWYAKSLMVEVPDERNEVVINDFQFDIGHWITTHGYTTCVFDKTAYVAFGRQV